MLAVCVPAHVTRLPVSASGACFAGPHSPWSSPFAPPAPWQLALVIVAVKPANKVARPSNELAILIDRRHSLSCCQRRELFRPPPEKFASADEERACSEL